MTIPLAKPQILRSPERVETVSASMLLEPRFLAILLVDDEPLILSPLSLCLEDSGHRVTTALSGQNALDLLRVNSFDLVITDLQMPGVNGITLLRRAKEIRPDTKVVIMTGSVLSESTRRLICEEADGFLAKPFSLAGLHRAVTLCFNSEVLSSDPRRQDLAGSLEALPP